MRMYPKDINNHGQVIGYSNDCQILLYRNGVISNLGTLDLESPSPEAINDQGQITGVGSIARVKHTFLLTPVSLSPPQSLRIQDYIKY